MVQVASHKSPPVLGQRPIMLLLLGTFLLHLPSLFNGLLMDDYVYIHRMREMSWGVVQAAFTSGVLDQDASSVWWTPEGELPFYRPLAVISIGLEYALWGFSPFGFHLTNLLLHILCTYLVWRLAGRWLNKTGALASAAVFAIHPVHSEAVLWVSGRFDLLVCVVMTLGANQYLRWRDRPSWVRLLPVIALYIIGLGCKETALIFPAMIVAFELFGRFGQSGGIGRQNRPPPGCDRRPPLAAIFAISTLMTIVGGAYLLMRFSLFGGLGSIPPPYGVDIHASGAVGTILFNMAQYLLDIVLFIQVDGILMSAYWAEHMLLLGGCVTVSLAILFWLTRFVWRESSFRIGVSWFVLFMSPALLAMPGERNIYLASAGLAIMGGAIVQSVGSRSYRWAKPVGLAVLGLSLVLTVADQLIMRRLAGASDRVYADIVAAWPDPPVDARVYVVNQCPFASVGFNQGLKLWYGREDVDGFVLSVSPTIESSTRDVVTPVGASTIRIHREGGRFFTSFVERFLLFAAMPDELFAAAERCGLTLVSAVDPYGDVDTFSLELPRAISATNMTLFEWNNQHVQGSLYELVLGAELPRTKRLNLLSSSPDVVPDD